MSLLNKWGVFLDCYGDSRHPTKARQGFWRMQAWLVTQPWQRRALCPFLSLPKRQKICRKISKIVKIYQHSKNIENKLKYFKKCVDKCATLYYIRLNKRETEQPNREGWERREKYKRIYRKRGIVHLTSKVLPQSSMMYN